MLALNAAHVQVSCKRCCPGIGARSPSEVPVQLAWRAKLQCPSPYGRARLHTCRLNRTKPVTNRTPMGKELPHCGPSG